MVSHQCTVIKGKWAYLSSELHELHIVARIESVSINCILKASFSDI